MKADKEKASPAEDTTAAENRSETKKPGLTRFECGLIEQIWGADGIFLSSQPEPGDLIRIRDGGVRTVISLRHLSEISWDEEDLARILEMDFYRLPMNSNQPVVERTVDNFRQLLKTIKKPVLIHCSDGARTAPMWLAYRVLDRGMSMRLASREIAVLGEKAVEQARTAIGYIERRQAGEEPTYRTTHE